MALGLTLSYIFCVTVFCFSFPLTFQREKKKSAIGKEYFKQKNLEAIVKNYPYKTNLPEDDVVKGKVRSLCALKFIEIMIGPPYRNTDFFHYYRISDPFSSD